MTAFQANELIALGSGTTGRYSGKGGRGVTMHAVLFEHHVSNASHLEYGIKKARVAEVRQTLLEKRSAIHA